MVTRSRKSDPCSVCGELMWPSPGSSAAVRVCHPCRRQLGGVPYGQRVFMPTQTCAAPMCETTFTPAVGTSKRPRKYCSLRCANSVNVDLMRAALRAAGKSTQPTATCPTCGTDFSAKMMKAQGGRPRQRQRFCSRKCGNAHRENRGRGRTRTRFPKCPVYFPECRRCSKVFTARTSARVFCDDECRRLFHYPPRPMFTETCVCGETFTTKQPDRKWCSRCSNDHGHHRKRARKHDVEYEPINPMEIYERDRWVCHICTEGIRKVPGSHIDVDGWSLDHVIPMVHGGPHLKWNVAASHWGCNVKKADRFFVEVA